MTFSQMVAESEIVVSGKVVDLKVIAAGTPNRDLRNKTHVPPRAPTAGGATAGAAGAPQEIGVEGGRMLFTQVTLEVEDEIVGQAGARISFKVAGGADERSRVVVHGLPSFESGRRYLVFLRRGFEQAGDPLVGVNQGYFQVVRDAATGHDVLLSSEGDFVVAVESDRVVTRFNQNRPADVGPRLGAAPVPDDARQARGEISPEISRYWSSQEAPMPKDRFVSTIRAKRGQR